MDEMITYKISEHAKKRYAERLMGKDNMNDINRFVIENEEKIKTDINKLIHYGEMIYAGKQSQKDGKGKVLNVYLKDCWIILVDNIAEVVVTLYKVDLGLDEEFNKAYVIKMLEKLNKYKKILEDIQIKVQSEINTYDEMINGFECQIKEYKTMTKNLEELISGYKTIKANNNVLVAQADRDVAEVINKFIGKKEF